MSAEDLLEKSLRLLEEAQASPNVGRSILRYTGRPSLERQLLTERTQNRDSRRSIKLQPSDFNEITSVMIRPGEMTRLLNPARSSIGDFAFSQGLNDSVLSKPGDSLHLHESDFLNSSITLRPNEVSRLLDGSQAKSGLLNVQGSDRLYRDFLESFFLSQAHGLSGQVFDIVADFIQNCVNLLTQKYSNEDNGNIVDPDIAWLENERNTWKLVYALYKNRLSAKSEEIGHQRSDSFAEAFKNLSEKEVVAHYYKDDNEIREAQLVVDWLEKIAVDQYNVEVSPQLGHFTDKTVAWENTLHQLQNERISYASSRPVVSSLDPDAPLREKKPLHDLDMEDEARLVQQIFIEIRCGRIDQAHTLCYHAGQPWRAATLEGWRLYHDPNYNLPPKAEKLPVEGNPNRDIWKLCAWGLADDVRAPIMARAVHGALCGHLQSLFGVCKSWEDLLWAYTRVLVDVNVEQQIRNLCGHIKEYIQMPEAYWNHKLILEDIFTELEASSDHLVSGEAVKPERIVQKLLILNKVPDLMNQMGDWIQTDSCKPQFVRFLAHLVLVLRLVGQSYNDDVGDSILKAYVKVLVNQGDPELVAYYVATLPQEDQVQIFANYLESITEYEERQLCLKAAESVELQVEAITQRVVENIRNKVTEQQSGLNLLGEVTENDHAKVSALDWVVFYPQQRAEALWQANALIRYFLSLGKLDAARLAFNKIPGDSVELVTTQCQLELGVETITDINNMPVKISAAVREYICHKAYLDAQDGFSDWFHHYHNAKPVVPAKPGAGATFTEKVAYDHRMAQYNKEFERWKAAMSHQTKSVKAQLYNVLVFPDGGWLVDFEPEDKLRQQQMQSLRSLCLPKIVLLLHMVLQNSGEYNECIQLADLIVSEQYELYKVYSKQQLGELLIKLSETSLYLLDNKRDPWGHPLSS